MFQKHRNPSLRGPGKSPLYGNNSSVSVHCCYNKLKPAHLFIYESTSGRVSPRMPPSLLSGHPAQTGTASRTRERTRGARRVEDDTHNSSGKAKNVEKKMDEGRNGFGQQAAPLSAPKMFLSKCSRGNGRPQRNMEVQQYSIGIRTVSHVCRRQHDDDDVGCKAKLCSGKMGAVLNYSRADREMCPGSTDSAARPRRKG